MNDPIFMEKLRYLLNQGGDVNKIRSSIMEDFIIKKDYKNIKFLFIWFLGCGFKGMTDWNITLIVYHVDAW